MKLRAPLNRDPEEEAADNPLHDAIWLYSYADLITQMLLFIILMVTTLGLKEFDGDMTDAEQPAEHRALTETQKVLEEYIREHGLQQAMQIDKSADRLVIRLKSVLLFELGRAALTTRARSVLKDVGGTLRVRPFNIRVEGHTDDVPIRTAQFPSNWELSTARAISVIQYFEGLGIESERMSAAGYGKYHPIVGNSSQENRALNRRVELVILGGAT